MKQFTTILGFEFMNYLRNKAFIFTTVVMAAVIGIVLMFPRFASAAEIDITELGGEEGVMALETDVPGVKEAFTAAFPDYSLVTDVDIEEGIRSGDIQCGFKVDSLEKFSYFVADVELYDSNYAIASDVLREMYRTDRLSRLGVSPEEVGQVMSFVPEGSVTSTGVDRTKNFLYTYIMVMALYMVIVIYGQMVASNVASEKASRAMELLVTSADPVAMMFGKVIASGLAGLTQLLAVFGSGFLFYNLSRGDWAGNELVASLFDIPAELLLYMVVFFILGFFVYAFLFGAVGSMVSKLEDVSTATMPLMMVFVAVYMIVIVSLSSGGIDNPLMFVCSFIPLTSPMAMFARIAMTTVPLWEKAVSVVLLVGGVIAAGFAAAKIYRVGVLMYGTKPTPKAIWKALTQK